MPFSGWFSGLSSPSSHSVAHAPHPARSQERPSRRRANVSQSAPVTPPNGAPALKDPPIKPMTSIKCKRPFTKSRTELLRTPDHIPHDIEAKTQALMTEATRNYFEPLPAEHKSKLYEVVETSTRHAQQNRDLKTALVEREQYILALHDGLDAQVLAERAQKEELQRELAQVRAELALIRIPSRSSDSHRQSHKASSEPSESLLIETVPSEPASVSAPESRSSVVTGTDATQASLATQTEASSLDPRQPLRSRPALPRRATDTALLCIDSKEDLDVVSPFARLVSDRSGISYDEVLERLVEITTKSFSPPRMEQMEVASPAASPPVNVDRQVAATRPPTPPQPLVPSRSVEPTSEGSVTQRTQQRPRMRRASNARTTVFPSGNVRSKTGERRVTLPRRARQRNTQGSIDEDSPSDLIFPEPDLAE